METLDLHRWVRLRLAAWRAGLLPDTETERVARHLAECADCRALGDAFSGAAPVEAHLPPSLLAGWTRAAKSLRGLERAMARHHLERCAECRQDLELLGHEPVLAHVPGWELEAAPAPAFADPARGASVSETGPSPRVDSGRHVSTRVGTRNAGAGGDAPARDGLAPIVRIVSPRPRWRERFLVGWSLLATAAAVIAIVVHLRRPVVEGVPFSLLGASPPPAASSAAMPAGALSFRFGPRPRKLSGPASEPGNGKLNVIPVAGPVRSLALTVRPLDVPDTSIVMVSLVSAAGDTLFSVRHRQWEFFPKRVLMIEGTNPLEPGQYALVLASIITGHTSPVALMSRYRFELRPRG